jgi:hypothetical protein
MERSMGPLKAFIMPLSPGEGKTPARVRKTPPQELRNGNQPGGQRKGNEGLQERLW